MDMSILEQAKALPLEERALLAEALWASLVEDGYEPSVSDLEAGELDRRLKEHQEDPSAVIPWSEIKQAALAKFGR